MPSVDDLILPILRGISDGREYTTNDLEGIVAKSMNLSEDDLGQLAPSGKTTQVRYRISWVKSLLKKAELAYYPSRGIITITEKGLETLRGNPSRINWRPKRPTKKKEGTSDNDLSNDVPTLDDMMLPLLRGIGDGRKYSMSDLERMVVESLNLSRDVLGELMLDRQTTKVRHRLGWAKSYLKNAGLVKYPSRGMVEITIKGSDILSLDLLRIDRAYLNEIADDDMEPDEGDDEGDDDDDLTPEETIMREYEKIKRMLKNELLEKVRAMTPRGFELMVLDLCKKMNADTRSVHTGKPGDKGIDGIVTLNDGFGLSKIYVQAKKHKNPVTSESVRAFVGALSLKATKKGIFMTTGEIPRSVKEEVEKNESVSVRLIDGNDLVRLMMDRGAGVTEDKTLRIQRIDDEYFNGMG